MTGAARSFDDVWEDLYQGGGRHRNRYPFDSVVQFVFRHCPKEKARSDVRILEVGCGTGNNIWFMALEGFQVVGIDGSAAAIEMARRRFEEDGLTADLHVGDIVQLPFADASFDLIVDRAAITHMSKQTAILALADVRRVLKPGGWFHFNPFGDMCSSAQRHAHNKNDKNGVLTDITKGWFVGIGQTSVYNKTEIEALFDSGWSLESLMRVEKTEMNAPQYTIHEEWIALAKKS